MSRDYRDLVIETLEHERYAAEQRAEGYLLLLSFALAQFHESTHDQRRQREAQDRIIDQYRALREQRMGRPSGRAA